MAKILIVDDEPDLLFLLQATFEGAGHEVVSTSDPRNALPLASSHPIDAIILDIMMPSVSGWDVLAALRRTPETRQIPILVLSALRDACHRVRGLRGGADDYVVKPFDAEELVVRAESMIAKRKPATAGLQGRLESFPLTEALQGLQQNAKTGELLLTTTTHSGRLVLHDGRIQQASYAGLTERQAVVEMLSLGAGRFRFQPLDDLEEPATSNGDLPTLQSLLLEVAWLKDELAHRRAYLPSQHGPLTTTANRTPIPADFRHLPIDAIHQHLSRRDDYSLETLQLLRIAPDLELRLALAWMIEHGWVRVAEDAVCQEDIASENLDVAVRELCQKAIFREIPLEDVRVDLRVQEGSWSRLLPLLEGLAPAADSHGSPGWIDDLFLAHEGISIRFSVDTLVPDSKEPQLSEHAVGMVCCLNQAASASDLNTLLGDLIDQSAAQETSCLLITTDDSIRHLATAHLGDRPGWKVSQGFPPSLDALLIELAEADS